MPVEHASANLRLGSRISRRKVIRTGLGAIAVPIKTKIPEFPSNLRRAVHKCLPAGSQ